ncbi:MAG: phospholipid carrier-dependent glycosyltransferase [Victivallaceae bacterium]|nr:phospholipid carrier-dependent glycosyltransferase [Victivallaceae bacterium]
MKKYYYGLILIYLVIYILPLGGRPLLTPDEFRYAEISREMLETGDWVVPKLIGVRYFEKPVLGYWLNAVSLALFGENRFAVRFSSALTTGLAALLLFFLVLKVRRDQEDAALTAGLFLTFGMVFGIGTFAVLDAPTMFFITGTLVFFYLGCEQEKWSRAKAGALTAAGVFAGLAFLTKGFLAFAVPAVTIIPYLIWTGRWKQIFVLPWIPLAFMLLTALPWSLLIMRREPGFWPYFFWDEHIGRFFQDAAIHHPEPFYFLLPFLLLGVLPPALFAPAAAAGFGSRTSPEDKLTRFALCWLIFPFLFFSACRGKLPTYVLPCFAPAAMLFSRGLLAYFRAGKSALVNVTARILMFLLLAGVLIFALLQVIADYGVYRGMYASGELWKWLTAGGAVLIWAFCLFKIYRTKKYRVKSAFLLLGPIPLFFFAHFIIPGRYLEGKAQGLFLRQFRDRVKPGMIIVAHPNMMHAAAWVFKARDILLYTHGGELERGLKYADAKNRVVSKGRFRKLLRSTPPGRIVYIMRGDFREGVPKAGFECYDHEIMFSIF